MTAGRATRILAAFSCLALMAGPGTDFGIGVARAAPPASARQTYAISDFDSVRLEAPIDVVVTTGKGVSAIGTGDRDTLDALSLDISSRSLTIRMRNQVVMGGTGGRLRAPTRLTLTTGNLRRAILNGAGTLTTDRLTGARTEATVQGSGTLTVPRIDSDRIDVALLGAGSMILGGKVIEMAAAVGGSGRLDSAGLAAQRVRIDTEGSADAQVAASREAIASASGTGRLVIIGKAQCTARKIGNASISCGGAVY